MQSEPVVYIVRMARIERRVEVAEETIVVPGCVLWLYGRRLEWPAHPPQASKTGRKKCSETSNDDARSALSSHILQCLRFV